MGCIKGESDGVGSLVIPETSGNESVEPVAGPKIRNEESGTPILGCAKMLPNFWVAAFNGRLDRSDMEMEE